MHVILLVKALKKHYRCEACAKSFATSSHYTKHMSIHAADEVNPNDDQGVLESSRLAAPMALHTAEKPFLCELCGKGFAKRVVLRAHMHVHSKEERYQCKICDKRFKYSNQLSSHTRTHTGEKPYQCPVLWQMFRVRITPLSSQSR